jgi:hypothetical protein
MSPRRPPAFPTGQVVRIFILAALCVAIIVMKKRCGTAAENMFKAIETPQNVDGGLTSPDTPRK